MEKLYSGQPPMSRGHGRDDVTAYAFGAQFVEVRIHSRTREIRVPNGRRFSCRNHGQSTDRIQPANGRHDLGNRGIKGIGEIGIVGVNAAIANAVYHATGRRIRHLPIRIEHLL